MEFKFRAVDDRSSTFLPAPSNQPFPGPRGSVDHQQAVQRQLEKERIREEIFAAEIARRRALEAEVRMELMVDREMVMRRAAESGLSFEERVAMRFDPRYPFMMPHPIEGWVLEDHRMFPPPSQQDLKPQPTNDNFIFLAKPDPGISGAKRKAAVGASEPSSTVSVKKPKEEWSCALCQVSVTSEKGLNEHLQGKKHKAKEAGLRAERAAKNSSSGQIPKKTGKLKSAEATAAGSADPSPNPTDSKICEQKIKDLEDKEGKMPLQKIQNKEQLMKGEATQDTKQKRKYKRWCEICKVGAYSERVMENHKKGKKHVARLKEVGLQGSVPDSGKEAKETPGANVPCLAPEEGKARLKEVGLQGSVPDSGKEAKETPGANAPCLAPEEGKARLKEVGLQGSVPDSGKEAKETPGANAPCLAPEEGKDATDKPAEVIILTDDAHL